MAPFTLPNVEHATKTGIIHAITPSVLPAKVWKKKNTEEIVSNQANGTQFNGTSFKYINVDEGAIW